MHYLLFIGAFFFFAFTAPLKVTLATCILLLLVTTIIRFTTRAVAGIEPSYGEALKAVGLSFFFLVLAFAALLSFAAGTGISNFTGLAGHLVFFAFFAAYVLGFKLSLGISAGASAVVAIVATVASTALFVAFRTLG
ncbi:hypothetical protein [Caldimonas brevitalea]|uniref:Uncharacterized protein n=1 Tax=Caldimonas brevitalea TaxID=413882 RepID=A0A0G3BNY6_9BURK|nr:hypothetical protein [Caldimonas brevitalea]AKJ29066.1 hypothetical protein AAW51_2375 [Caldimonas brevitalea]